MNIKDTLIDVKNLSDAEKRKYCKEWKDSELTAAEFCRAKQLPVSSFLYWQKIYRKNVAMKSPSSAGFSPVTVKHPAALSEACESGKVDVNIQLSHGLQIHLNLSAPQLCSLIQELSDATAIIR